MDLKAGYGINDHHTKYYPYNGIFSDPNQWIRTSATNNNKPSLAYDPSKPNKVTVDGFIGYTGFFAPHDMLIIDPNAVTDPFLARLPMRINPNWRIGHFERALPAGYMLARQSDDLSEMDPSLAQYYKKLRLVTSGELFDDERLQAIIGFQLGQYDYLIAEYLSRVTH